MRDWVLVSGGSGGIGAATCDALAARGYRPMVGHASNAVAARAIAQRCDGLAQPLDLRSPASIDEAVARLASLGEPLAGVVLAASPPPTVCAFGRITADDMLLQWQVNVLGPQRLAAGLVKACFRPRMAGAVLGVLSAAMAHAGQGAASGMGAYVIAKYGLAGMLDALSAEFPWLRVSSVRPGFTETAMLQAFDERYLELMRAQSPFTTADEVAQHIVGKLFPT